MRLTDISELTVRDTIGRMPKEFRTKDVSEHPLMRQGHRQFEREASYHALVGKFLRRLSLGLTPPIRYLSDGGGHPRGALWARTG